METSTGFPPVAAPGAVALVLGSLPGKTSLAMTEYYAHPRNAFWPIMNEIFGIRGDYHARCSGLKEHRIALWDVLQGSIRPGSLDSDIRMQSAVANDFETFLVSHPCIVRIAFNGQKAEQLFRRMVPKAVYKGLHLVGLPSTSPAYAAMRLPAKLLVWRQGLTGAPRSELDA